MAAANTEDDGIRANVRYNSGDESGVRSGFESDDVPSDLTVPSCTIEDVDRSVMSLFDVTIAFQVSARDATKSRVPVIFATGERFAMLNRNKPIRDKEGKFVLPLVSIRRTGVQQTAEDIAGRGMNQHTGDMIVKRRIGVEDRLYQRIVNKLGIKNQQGLADFGGEPDPTGTESETGGSTNDPIVAAGGLLLPQIGNNMFELISLPQPQFYTAEYEVSFWTQYTQQMNEMLEQLMQAQLPQGRTFRLNTPKGYWFVMYLDEAKSSADNFQDFTEKERIVKYTFTAKVPAYLIAGDQPGMPVPVRRTISSPRVSFDIVDMADGPAALDPSLQADDPSLAFTLSGQAIRRTEAQPQRRIDAHKGTAASSRGRDGKLRKTFTRVLQENQKQGETVYDGDPFVKLDTV